MISDTNQMLAEVSRPRRGPKNVPSFLLFPWRLPFSQFLIPQGVPLFHTAWLPDVTSTLTSTKDSAHTKQLVKIYTGGHGWEDGGWSSNVLWLLL